MTTQAIHNHPMNNECVERGMADGTRRGQCVGNFAPGQLGKFRVPSTAAEPTAGEEHFAGCPCPRCLSIREAKLPPAPLAYHPCCGATVQIVRSAGARNSTGAQLFTLDGDHAAQRPNREEKQ